MAIFIQDTFEFTDKGVRFSDAIVLPKSEYDALTPTQITTFKTDRFNNWKTVIATPPPAPSKAEQLIQVDKDLLSLEDQKTQLLNLKASLK